MKPESPFRLAADENQEGCTPPIRSREIRLHSRPRGRPKAANFKLATVSVAAPKEGHVLVRNNYLSLDPCSFCRMRRGKSYLAPFELGRPLEGGAVGTVVESRSRAFKPGDAVISNLGWREWFVAPSEAVRPVDRQRDPFSAYLDVLGLQGLCSWASAYLLHVKPSGSILVNGAAVVAGSVASQLANLRNCRIIGSAGSRDMVSFLREECGFDIAFDYKAGPVLTQLTQDTAHFDGTGNRALEAALRVCMAGSCVAKSTPGATGNRSNLPLPVYFLSQ